MPPLLVLLLGGWLCAPASSFAGEADAPTEAEATEAPADGPPPEAPPPARAPQAGADPWAPTAALHLGPTLTFSQLGAGFVPRVEAGVVLPWLGGELSGLIVVSNTRPTARGAGGDPGLPAGTSWEVQQHIWMLGLGAQARFGAPTSRLRPEALVSPQIHFLRAVSNGTGGGADFGTQVQTDRRFGVLLAGGASMAVGPGALVGQLGLHWSGIDGLLTGRSTTAGLAPTLGYRMTL